MVIEKVQIIQSSEGTEGLHRAWKREIKATGVKFCLASLGVRFLLRPLTGELINAEVKLLERRAGGERVDRA